MKKIIMFLLTIFLSVFLFSCGSNNNNNNEYKPSLDTETKCKIKIVGSYDNFEALESEFDKFNKYYPNVQLSYEKLDDYNNNLSTVLEGNAKPNIFFSYTWMIGNEKYNSVVSHMEDIKNSPINSNLDCIRPGLINNDENGKVLMIPVFSRTYGMLINNDLFKKYNINIPTTFNELKDVCNSFKNEGYASPMMGYTEKSSSCLMNTIAYPLFVAALADNKEALALANNKDPQAGEYMREALNVVKELADNNNFNVTECDKIKDNYGKVILRFFEGDVPMMVCTGDTVSGTKKREAVSEAFKNSPFSYSFVPIPSTSKGGYFIDSPSIQFSVNKDCNDLEMTNEFMKFLISEKELNAMAAAKGLVSPTKNMPLDSIYAPFSNIPSNRTISPEVIGIKDPLTVQIRIASYKVGRGEISIDEAVQMYGSFKE